MGKARGMAASTSAKRVGETSRGCAAGRPAREGGDWRETWRRRGWTRPPRHHDARAGRGGREGGGRRRRLQASRAPPAAQRTAAGPPQGVAAASSSRHQLVHREGGGSVSRGVGGGESAGCAPMPTGRGPAGNSMYGGRAAATAGQQPQPRTGNAPLSQPPHRRMPPFGLSLGGGGVEEGSWGGAPPPSAGPPAAAGVPSPRPPWPVLAGGGRCRWQTTTAANARTAGRGPVQGGARARLATIAATRNAEGSAVSNLKSIPEQRQ